jgi:hypothetical protein
MAKRHPVYSESSLSRAADLSIGGRTADTGPGSTPDPDTDSRPGGLLRGLRSFYRRTERFVLLAAGALLAFAFVLILAVLSRPRE